MIGRGSAGSHECTRRSRCGWLVLVLVPGSLATLACGGSASRGELAMGAVRLQDTSGRDVGSAVFVQSDGGVAITVDVHGLPPGPKGVHVHETGSCEAPDFKSAGGHFNPDGRRHGKDNPEGPHAGDLPNMEVAADGSGRLETTDDRLTLAPGSSALLDADGSAVVVHAGPDDYRTDPAGNSGDRVACGVVRPAT